MPVQSNAKDADMEQALLLYVVATKVLVKCHIHTKIIGLLWGALYWGWGQFILGCNMAVLLKVRWTDEWTFTIIGIASELKGKKIISIIVLWMKIEKYHSLTQRRPAARPGIDQKSFGYRLANIWTHVQCGENLVMRRKWMDISVQRSIDFVRWHWAMLIFDKCYHKTLCVM